MQNEIGRLLEIMARLRGPGGCPWDQEQTHASIKPQLIEECYEIVEAIDNGDLKSLKEELGDVLLHVVFHSQLARESGHFTFEDVAREISDKLVRRHPHVFGDVKVEDSAEVLKNWDRIKREEKPERTGFFDGVPHQLPALMRAQEIQKKARKVGFDWPDAEGALRKVAEEVGEVGSVLFQREKAEEELGDLLFASVNLARHLKVDAEQALGAATRKFQRRFERMQAKIESGGKKLENFTLEEMDAAWEEVKVEEVAGV